VFLLLVLVLLDADTFFCNNVSFLLYFGISRSTSIVVAATASATPTDAELATEVTIMLLVLEAFASFGMAVGIALGRELGIALDSALGTALDTKFFGL